MRIFVCDDVRPEDICGALDTARDRGAPIPAPEKVFSQEHLAKELKELFGALDDAVAGKEIRGHGFDKADLILLDYGLTAVKLGSGPRLTADHVAGYLRAFSSSAYVVSLNRLPTVDFDLKHLVGDSDSRGDLSLNTEHLEEPGLWHGRPNEGAFCPWYWPSLDNAAERRSEQVNRLQADLDRPLLELLGFPEELDPYLSRRAIAFLSPQASEGDDRVGTINIRDVSAWDHFYHSSRTLSKDDRRDLVNGQGGNWEEKRRPDSSTLDKIIARVVAAELDFWFRRDVLGPQRLLIDTPHLLAAFPYRDKQELADPAAWNPTVYATEAPFGLAQSFAEALPNDSTPNMWPWIARQVFWFPAVEGSMAIDSAMHELHRGNDLCFCEDTREFLPRNDCYRFATELGTGLDIRYVRRVPGRRYSPESAFAY